MTGPNSPRERSGGPKITTKHHWLKVRVSTELVRRGMGRVTRASALPAAAELLGGVLRQHRACSVLGNASGQRNPLLTLTELSWAVG